MSKRHIAAAFAYLLATAFALACVGCALLRSRTPAEIAADALAAEAVAHDAATRACAVYESGLVSRAVPPDATVSGRCKALRP